MKMESRDSQYESFINIAGAGAESINDDATTLDAMFSGDSLLYLLGAKHEASSSMPLFTTTEFTLPPLYFSALPPLPPASFDFFDGAYSHSFIFPNEPLGFEGEVWNAHLKQSIHFEL